MRSFFKYIISSVAAILVSVSGATGQTLSFPSSESATVGFMVKDLRDGSVIASSSGKRLMIPASTLKSVVAAAALIENDTAKVFETPVVMEGTMAGGTLKGNLVIKASGDPTIDSSMFECRIGFADSIVANLERLGVKRICGDIVVDDEWFKRPGPIATWEIEDYGYEYGAGVYGFNWRDNVAEISPSTETSVPEMPGIFINCVEHPYKTTEIFHGADSDDYTIYHRGPINHGFTPLVPMNNPAEVFVHNIKKKLAEHGIRVEEDFITLGEEIPSTPVYTHRSPSLAGILRSMMVYSHNLYAESMLRSLCAGGWMPQALAAEAEALDKIGVKVDGQAILDGSGLSRGNLVSAEFLVDLLAAMAKSYKAQTYVSLYPIAGVNGTVKSLLRDTRLSGKMALKSGSMNRVLAYAGYKLDDLGNPTHAVAVIVNGYTCPFRSVRDAIARLLLDIFPPDSATNK